jgi:phosphodiesterase/alkaline phosphatase D-like protein
MVFLAYFTNKQALIISLVVSGLFLFVPVFSLAASLSHGPFIGATTDTAAKIWARSDSAATVKVNHKLTTDTAYATSTGTSLISGNDFTGTVSITGLTASTTYDYRILIDDVIQSGSTGQFSTMKAAGSACAFDFAVGGDMAIAYTPFNFSVFSQITAKNPDFMIFVGDQIYGPEIGTQSSFETYYKNNWVDTYFATFGKNHPMRMIWDDHELGTDSTGDWSWGKTGQYAAGRAAFNEYQAALNGDPLVSGELYNTWRVCDTDFFMVDGRTHRSEDTAFESSNTTMLGTAQKEHLKSWLKNSTGTFRFIVSPSPWPNNIEALSDSFETARVERQEIYDFIKANNIQNVVVFSGDQHNVVLYKTALSPTNNIYEFNATPLLNGIQRVGATESASGSSTVVCTNSTTDKHFGMVAVDTTASPAQVTFNAYNDAGTNVACINQTITATMFNPTPATISSGANQSFTVGDGTTAISTITVTDASTATITAGNGIRIRIPTAFNMVWDTTDTTATIGGGASAKVSGTVSYENSGKTLVLNVTSNFSASDSITVSGLSFKTFSDISPSSNLTLDAGNDGGGEATDDKTIAVKPASAAALVSSANQVFSVSDSTTAIQTITVIDAGTPTITAANDIRIRIPTAFNMVWDTTDTSAVIGGGAAGKVSGTVTYEDAGKTLVLNATSDFAGGDSITVSGLSFKTFSGTSAASNLELETDNLGGTADTDSKTIRIVSATTRVWDGGGNDTIWSNTLNWSSNTVPIAGDTVIFDGTYVGTTTVDVIANNLASITLDTGFTGGVVEFPPYVVGGTTSSLTLTGNLTVTEGTMIFEGDSHIDSVSGTAVNDGTGYTITAASITVGASGKISADGEGFEQGIGPGMTLGDSAGAPGGSYGGLGGAQRNYATRPTASAIYGSATGPLSLGSGGGYTGTNNAGVENGRGGGGGGALKFNISGTMTVSGIVSANGDVGTQRYGSGSGGSIWINGGTLAGAGTISAAGGASASALVGGEAEGGAGGGGRIDISNTTNSFTGTLSVLGGAQGIRAQRGNAGTIAFPSAQLSNFTLSNALTLGNDISYTFGTLTIASGGTLTLDSNPATGAGTGGTISATTLTINSGGTLTANAMGYEGKDSNGPGKGVQGVPDGRSSGAGYGGRGGNVGITYGTGVGGATYGTSTSPTALGSGGGGSSIVHGQDGGGAIKLTVTGTLTVNGTLSANGENDTSEFGAGSGGSIWVLGGILAGSGTISANGGNGLTGGGAGGGGRIDIASTTNSFSGTISVAGGTEGSFSGRGKAGTIIFPSSQLSNFTLSNALTLGNDISYTFGTLTIASGGTLTLDGNQVTDSGNGTGGTINATTLTIDSGGTLTANAKGHNCTSGPSGGMGQAGTSSRHGGGAYGGAGAVGSPTYGSPAGGVSYGSTTTPTTLGSAYKTQSSNCSGTTHGGGAIRLVVSGALTVNGTLSANGSTGGASGGSIYTTSDSLAGSGTISATGGSTGDSESGGGGGGRIALYYATKTYSGTPSIAGGTGYATGGTGSLYEEVTNNAPSATLDNDWSTWQGGNITANYNLIDADGNTSNISQTANSGIEYSTDNTTWADATDGGGASEGLTGLTATTSPGTNHVFTWASGTDLASTEDSSVYIRVRPNDGTANANAWATSTAFGLDNVAPSAVGVPTFGAITSSSIAVIMPTTVTENGSGTSTWQVRRNGATTLSAVSTTTTSVTDSSLSDNTQYTYDVRFTDTTGNTSNYGTSATKYTAAPTPSGLVASVSASSVTLSVSSFTNSTTDSSGYYFTNTTTGASSGWIQTNSWTNTSLTCGLNYSYSVKYRNAEGVETATITATASPNSCGSIGFITAPPLPVTVTTRVAALTSAQIQSILSLLSSFGADSSTIANVQISLMGGTPSVPSIPTSSCSFTKDLMIGSTGSEVTCLQQALIKGGYAIPAGATGYFGVETRTAVSVWQKALGITPTRGYFGALSRREWGR